MKKLLFMMAVLFLGISANAQDSKQEESKSTVVKLLKKDGVLLRKDFYDIGKVDGVTFENIIITDISTGEKSGALRLKTFHYSSLGTDTYIGTLDFDELSGCIKSLTYMKNNIMTSTPENYTECEYRTKDDVCLGAYLEKENTWSIYVKTRDYINDSREVLNSGKIDDIIRLLNNSLDNLKAHL